MFSELCDNILWKKKQNNKQQRVNDHHKIINHRQFFSKRRYFKIAKDFISNDNICLSNIKTQSL